MQKKTRADVYSGGLNDPDKRKTNKAPFRLYTGLSDNIGSSISDIGAQVVIGALKVVEIPAEVMRKKIT